MRVLLLIDSLGSGGAQRQLCLLARELKQCGWSVQMLVYHPQFDHFGPFLAEADVPVVRLFKAERLSLRIPLEVAWHALHGGYNVMLAFLSTPAAYGAFARMAGSAPLVVSERIGFDTHGPTPAEWLLAQVQRLASAIVCNSHHHHEQFVKAFPWLKKRTLTIYNGAELSPLSLAVERKCPLSLLAIGTVTGRKNYTMVIEALGILQAKGEDLPRVSWAGKAGHAAADQAARNAADQRLHELGLVGNWEWLGERSDVPRLLAECDALIHASMLEGFPNAIGEALAAGRPILASDVGDHARLVSDGENGFLFDPCIPESIAEAILRFQGLNTAEQAALRRSARETAEQHLSVKRMANEYDRLFHSIAGYAVI